MHIRPLRFPAPEDLPKYWYQNNPVLTHAFNAVLLMFPKGELFFIDAVTAYRKEIHDQQLMENVQLFTAQEAHHSRAHQLHNDYLKSLGYDIDTIEQDQDRKFKKLKKILTKKQRLAVVVAYEHFTAIFAETVLKHSAWLENIHPVYQDFLCWHAIEEIEHKAVAFDVYNAMGGGYFTRIGMMILAFLAFYKSLFTYLNYFRKVDHLSKWQTVKALAKFIFVKPASFFQLTPGYLHYFLPNFHPNKRHDEPLLVAWKQINEARVLERYSIHTLA